MWPVAQQLPSLASFLEFGGRPLSPRAALGLLSRLLRYGAKVPERFVKDLSVIAGESEVSRLSTSDEADATPHEPLPLWDEHADPEYDLGH